MHIINQLQLGTYHLIANNHNMCNKIPYTNTYEAQALEPFDIYLNLYGTVCLHYFVCLFNGCSSCIGASYLSRH